MIFAVYVKVSSNNFTSSITTILNIYFIFLPHATGITKYILTKLFAYMSEIFSTFNRIWLLPY